MTKKPPPRDREYYLGRLQRDAPSHYADLLAGRHATVNEAAKAAGLVRNRTPLQEMKNAFKKASTLEQEEFKKFIGCISSTSSSPSVPLASVGAVAIGRNLSVSGITRLREVMDRRGLKMGQVMKELGRKSLDQSLSSAVARNWRVQPDLIVDLEAWLEANKAPRDCVD